MKKVKVKHPDIFQLAHAIVELATDESEQTVESITKNIKAMSEGGKKGARKRADKLTPEQRSEIARKAAKARWKK
jgi:DNA invertase Pin-like site-specific DNA recombinase